MSAAAVTDDDRRAFREHGVVVLRSALPTELVASLAEPVARAIGEPEVLADMSALGDSLAGSNEGAVVHEPGRGRFRSGVDHWRIDPAMREFALRSPLPALVASLLESEALHLYEDSILVKEPGTREPTVFHQDHPYFSVDGDNVCTTWIPLDPVTRATGAIGYVRGSHLDITEWRPNLFVTRDAIAAGAGVDVPDFHADPGDADIAWFDVDPGDVIVHHARTLHGAGPNTSATVSRRAVSVRYCGDGVVFRRRALTPKPHHDTMSDGEALRAPEFPAAEI